MVPLLKTTFSRPLLTPRFTEGRLTASTRHDINGMRHIICPSRQRRNGSFWPGRSRTRWYRQCGPLHRGFRCRDRSCHRQVRTDRGGSTGFRSGQPRGGARQWRFRPRTRQVGRENCGDQEKRERDNAMLEEPEHSGENRISRTDPDACALSRKTKIGPPESGGRSPCFRKLSLRQASARKEAAMSLSPCPASATR